MRIAKESWTMDVVTPCAIPPHPPLSNYYASTDERAGFVRAVFDRTAPHYDRINRLLSLGSGAWYRRQALRRAGLRPGTRVLDVAVGTGLLGREAVRIAGEAGWVAGIDVTANMLAQARRTLTMPLVQGGAEALPFADASFDFLSMGYALRHMSDLGTPLCEFHRVLHPGGTVLLLEIGRPAGRVPHALAALYLGRLVPLISRLSTAEPEARTLMRYYWDTIEQCVPAEVILRAMENAGFAHVRCETALGVFRAYSGQRGGARGHYVNG